MPLHNELSKDYEVDKVSIKIAHRAYYSNHPMGADHDDSVEADVVVDKEWLNVISWGACQPCEYEWKILK